MAASLGDAVSKQKELWVRLGCAGVVHWFIERGLALALALARRVRHGAEKKRRCYAGDDGSGDEKNAHQPDGVVDQSGGGKWIC